MASLRPDRPRLCRQPVVAEVDPLECVERRQPARALADAGRPEGVVAAASSGGGGVSSGYRDTSSH